MQKSRHSPYWRRQGVARNAQSDSNDSGFGGRTIGAGPLQTRRLFETTLSWWLPCCEVVPEPIGFSLVVDQGRWKEDERALDINMHVTVYTAPNITHGPTFQMSFLATDVTFEMGLQEGRRAGAASCISKPIFIAPDSAAAFKGWAPQWPRAPILGDILVGLRPVAVTDGSTARRDGSGPVRQAPEDLFLTAGYGTGLPGDGLAVDGRHCHPLATG
ncbi:hypothetical protein C8F04DRAFT_1176403 [Mycena alexandri]|uniref:Uncharacterized protein n=1 Tax=Mycena alexandri TaxID=1745969 RepID=A0AAD6TDB5_9AGAR|nr:hypothetical protein C8F04DRAFT_1176403 [Mycena alexandri]